MVLVARRGWLLKVGALFAVADEAAAKGDKAAVRSLACTDPLISGPCPGGHSGQAVGRLAVTSPQAWPFRSIANAAGGMLLFGTMACALAQPSDLVPQRAEGSGCTVHLSRDLVPPTTPGMKRTISWDGACIGGSARGLGTLSVEFVIDTGIERASPTKSSSRQTMIGGRPFGYMGLYHTTGSYSYTVPQSVPGIGFVHEGLEVAFSEGWGLSLQGIEVGGTTMKIPDIAPVTTRRNQFIKNGYKTLMLMGSSCLLHKTLPSCNGWEEGVVFELAEFNDSLPALARYEKRRITYCADPHEIKSCAPLVERLGAPLRADILALIQRAKPEVEGILQRMTAFSMATAGPSAPVATAPAVQTAAVAIDVEKLSVGALFSAADEAAVKGDKVGARAALRALIRRFPDHPLAATAAKQLSAL